ILNNSKNGNMPPSTSNAVSSLGRHRPVVLALTAVAAGLTVYAIHSHFHLPSASSTSEPSSNTLHRSNAQRRRPNRQRSIDDMVGSSTEIASDLGVEVSYGDRYHDGQRIFGRYQYSTGGKVYTIWLAPRQLQSTQAIQSTGQINPEDASVLRWHMEVEFLNSFFAQMMPPGPPIPLTEYAKNGFILEFAAADQIERWAVLQAIARYQSGELQDHPARSTEAVDPNEPRPSQLWLPSPDAPPPGIPYDLSTAFRIFRDAIVGREQSGEVHIAETESNQSNEIEVDEHKSSQDQNLMNLLYRIAEDQAKKEGYVHRGVNCNSCNAMPIRGIRYRCTNCHDYDLCEQCESLQVHEKTHIFYKIRIPAPFLGNPREPTPVWYPGEPQKVCRNLTTELKTMLSAKTGIQDRQVDAYWEQFQCLASSDYPDDPHGFRVAIDRCDFNKCFVPSTGPRPPPPNLIYDRIFSFYDTNNDRLIGFEEFLEGIACIEKKGSHLRAGIFQAYDIDSDGYVTRKDFLRIFKAYYALTKELTAQVISGMDDEFFDEDDARQMIQSTQPISSIFSGPIPPGDPSHSGMGKAMDCSGEMLVVDGHGFLLEDGTVDQNVEEPQEPASPADPSPVSKRSRSSSKVRFEDDPVGDDDQDNRSTTSISSRSIPVGERWGGYEVPGPEIDVGRDMIYQITQAGMNELLDLMFKLREDLAIEVKKTRWERRLRKEAIKECMSDNFVSKALTAFQVYEKRWYWASRESDDVGTSSSHTTSMFIKVMLECLREPDQLGEGPLRSDLNPQREDQDGSATTLQRATDAIVRLDQAVANEVSGESSAASPDSEHVTSYSRSNSAVGDLLPSDPAVAIELQEGIAAFDGTTDAMEESTKERPLELLLADAGYAVVTPPIQDLEWSSASSISSPTRSMLGYGYQDHVDRTLPQYRPDSVDEWQAKYGNLQDSADAGKHPQQQAKGQAPAILEPEDLPPLSDDRLMTLAIWTLVEEDDRKRGGPGRLNFDDFTMIMQGDKGEGLGFVGSWLETTTF
ncbi:MAG: hypothetical protein Q9224_003729, partial [Gallowayella concinna]